MGPQSSFDTNAIGGGSGSFVVMFGEDIRQHLRSQHHKNHNNREFTTTTTTTNKNTYNNSNSTSNINNSNSNIIISNHSAAVATTTTHQQQPSNHERLIRSGAVLITTATNRVSGGGGGSGCGSSSSSSSSSGSSSSRVSGNGVCVGNVVINNNHGIAGINSNINGGGDEGKSIFSLRNLVALLFAVFFMNLNFLVLAIVHDRVPRYYNSTLKALVPYPPLPDIASDILPEAHWALYVAEYIITIQVFSVFILLLIHKSRVTIFRRLCIIIGVLYMYRAMTMFSTQMPLLTSNYCAPPMTEEEKNNWTTYISIIFQRVFHMMLGFGLSINGMHIYCGDYIYSGHALMLTLCYLTLNEYLVPKSRNRTMFWSIFDTLALTSSFAGVLLVLIARGHYLIDVILAYYVTSRTFYIYHTLVYNKSLRYKNSKNLLSRVWWWYLLKYLEYDHVNCNAGICLKCDEIRTELPRKFDWPISWKSTGKRSASLQRLLNQ